MFTTLVSMAPNNMCSYVSLIEIIKVRKLTENDRDLKIVQMSIFELKGRSDFGNQNKSP